MSPRSRSPQPPLDPPPQQEPLQEGQPSPDPDLLSFTKAELVGYAAELFNVELTENDTKDELIHQVQGLINAMLVETEPSETESPETESPETESPLGEFGEALQDLADAIEGGIDKLAEEKAEAEAEAAARDEDSLGLTESLSLDGSFIIDSGMVASNDTPAGVDIVAPEGCQYPRPARLFPNPDGGNFVITG